MIVLNEKLLASFRSKRRCEWCGKEGPVDAAHVFTRGMGGGSRLDASWNVLALCRPCHDDHHAGRHPLRCDLLAVVAQRENLLQDEIVRRRDELLRRPKG